MEAIPLRTVKEQMGRTSEETRRLVDREQPLVGRAGPEFEDEEDVDAFISGALVYLGPSSRLTGPVANDTNTKVAQYARYRLFTAFAIFGLLNNGQLAATALTSLKLMISALCNYFVGSPRLGPFNNAERLGCILQYLSSLDCGSDGFCLDQLIMLDKGRMAANIAR